MNPLIPAPDTIPVHWGWLEALLGLTFPLHLLAMNALVGTALLALTAWLRGTATHRRLAGHLGRLLPVLMAITVNLGIAPFLFLQTLYGQFHYTGSVLMGGWWLAVVPMLIVAYAAFYLFHYQSDRLGRLAPVVLGVGLALPAAIAFLFTTNMTLMLDPGSWGRYFESSGGLLNLTEPTLWPRYLHFLVGAVAMGGLFVAVTGHLRRQRDPEVAELALGSGLRTFSHLTVLQIAGGFWFLASLSPPVAQRFLGGDAHATGLMLLGLLLAAAALASGLQRRVWATVSTAVPLLVVMTLMRDVVRDGYLAGVFHPRDLPLTPQYGPLILFLVSLAVGLGVLVWLLRVAARAGR